MFWRHGYEGASLADLTAAMGINEPSMYAAFGNKEELFAKVLSRYRRGPGAFAEAALAAPTFRELAERLVLGSVEPTAGSGSACGCLAVKGVHACGPAVQAASGVPRAELDRVTEAALRLVLGGNVVDCCSAPVRR